MRSVASSTSSHDAESLLTPSTDASNDADNIRLDALLHSVSIADLGHGDYVGIIVTVEPDGRGRDHRSDVVIATGVTVEGRLEAIAFDVGDVEDLDFWTVFVAGLYARGLHDVAFVAGSGPHLCSAARDIWPEAEWCRVPRMVANRLPRGHASYSAVEAPRQGSVPTRHRDDSEKQGDRCTTAKHFSTPYQGLRSTPPEGERRDDADSEARSGRVGSDERRTLNHEPEGGS